MLKVKGGLGELGEVTDRNNEWRGVENATSMGLCQQQQQQQQQQVDEHVPWKGREGTRIVVVVVGAGVERGIEEIEERDRRVEGGREDHEDHP